MPDDIRKSTDELAASFVAPVVSAIRGGGLAQEVRRSEGERRSTAHSVG
jgi:hypothetical protein